MTDTTPQGLSIQVQKELAGPGARKFMDRVMNRISNEVTLNLTGRVLHARTNRLRNSITTDIKVDGLQVQGKIGTNVFYGRIWETTGVRAHTIVPRKKKALAIPIGKVVSGEGSRANRIVRKSAYIPKQAPRPFIRPAIFKVRKSKYIEKLHAKYYKAILGPLRVRFTIDPSKAK